MVQLDTTSFLCSGAQHRFYEPCILSKTVSSYFVICGALVYAKMKMQKWIVIFFKKTISGNLKIYFILSPFLVIVVLYSVISFMDRLSGVPVIIRRICSHFTRREFRRASSAVLQQMQYCSCSAPEWEQCKAGVFHETRNCPRPPSSWCKRRSCMSLPILRVKPCLLRCDKQLCNVHVHVQCVLQMLKWPVWFH